MNKIHVAYGGPGQSGVTSIMGIGADEVDALSSKTDLLLNKAGWLGLSAVLFGAVSGSKMVRNVGIGAAIVAFGIKRLSR